MASRTGRTGGLGLVRKWIGWGRELSDGIGAIKDTAAILQFLGIPVATFFGFSRAMERAVPATMSFSVRLLVVTLLAGCLGALLGVTVSYLARRTSPVVAVAGYFIAILWGLLLIVIVDAMVPARGDQQLLQFSMLLLIALGVFQALLGFALGSWTGGVDVRASRERAVIVFAVTATAVLAGGLSRIGGLA